VHVVSYKRGKLLGVGGFAKCYEITNLETKEILATKIIKKNLLQKNEERQKIISEINIHKALSHPHVVQFINVFEDRENVYMLLELCTNQTLSELLKRRRRLTEIETKCYVLQILDALQYLKDNRVIHRDLKLSNIFLNHKLELKIGDFGLATKLERIKDKRQSKCGTMNFMAPEIVSKSQYTYEVDI